MGDWELAVAVGEADGMSVVMEGEPDGSADEPVVVGVMVGVAEGLLETLMEGSIDTASVGGRDGWTEGNPVNRVIVGEDDSGLFKATGAVDGVAETG